VSVVISITIQRSKYLTGSWYLEIVIDDLNMPVSCIFFFWKKGCLGSIGRRGIYGMGFIIVADGFFVVQMGFDCPWSCEAPDINIV